MVERKHHGHHEHHRHRLRPTEGFYTEGIVEVVAVSPRPDYWGENKKSPVIKAITVKTVDLLTGTEHQRIVYTEDFLPSQVIVESDVAVKEGKVIGTKPSGSHLFRPLSLNRFRRRT